MASAEIPRSATNPPRHLGYMAEFWEEVPPYIRDRLLRVSLDDACGYAAQARTSADNEAEPNMPAPLRSYVDNART